MTAIESTARMLRGRAAILAIAAALGVGLGVGLAVGLAGCGDSAGTPSSAGAIEKALYAAGDTQGVSCESLGTLTVAGVPREVARCSFEQEKSLTGEMRAVGGCFALEDGSALDVTMDVPADVSCFTKP